jgi:TPR repeat protein
MYYYGSGTPINYEKAWGYFKTSHEIYGGNKAATFLNISSRHPDTKKATDHLKRLEMWESVIKQLKKEDIYELGLLYYHDIYKNNNESESDKIAVIIESNTHKAADYFRIVVDKKLPGI